MNIQNSKVKDGQIQNRLLQGWDQITKIMTVSKTVNLTNNCHENIHFHAQHEINLINKSYEIHITNVYFS